MAGDIEAIEKVVWTYLDGLHEGDTGKLAQAFHAVAISTPWTRRA